MLLNEGSVWVMGIQANVEGTVKFLGGWTQISHSVSVIGVISHCSTISWNLSFNFSLNSIDTLHQVCPINWILGCNSDAVFTRHVSKCVKM